MQLPVSLLRNILPALGAGVLGMVIGNYMSCSYTRKSMPLPSDPNILTAAFAHAERMNHQNILRLMADTTSSHIDIISCYSYAFQNDYHAVMDSLNLSAQI